MSKRNKKRKTTAARLCDIIEAQHAALERELASHRTVREHREVERVRRATLDRERSEALRERFLELVIAYVPTICAYIERATSPAAPPCDGRRRTPADTPRPE